MSTLSILRKALLIALGAATACACGEVALVSPTDEAGAPVDGGVALDAMEVFFDAAIMPTPDATMPDATSVDSGGVSCQPGARDESFGDGGLVVLATAGAAVDVSYQSDGKLLLVGTSASGITIARLNVDGSLDLSYGTSGFTAPIGDETAVRMLAQADDKAVVIGAGGTVARYTTSGVLDPNFGTDGTIATGTALYSLSLTSDGRLLVGGDYGRVMRFNSDGTPDATFAGGGNVFVADGCPSGSDAAANPIVAAYKTGETILIDGVSCPGAGINTRGRIIDDDGDAGTLFFKAQGATNAVTADDEGGIVLWDEDSVSKLIFNDAGSWGTSWRSLSLGYGQALKLDKNGNVVVAGYAQGLFIARLSSRGVLDPAFGEGGQVLEATDGGNGPTGIDLHGCSIAVTGHVPGFAVARYYACCE